jgi:DNA mismatch repair protein MutS2
MTTFVAGDRVHVANLGTAVVREARNGGRYLIELKGRSMVVAGSQLESAPERPAAKHHRAAKRQPTKTTARDPALGTSTRSRSLDLHGKTVPEALDALDSFLNDALLEGVDDVRVIHGRSGGKLKAAVHGRLAELTVRAFRVDPGNPGVTIVKL